MMDMLERFNMQLELECEPQIQFNYVNKYIVKDLSIDEEVLTALEARYGIQIQRVAHPRREVMYASDTLRIQHLDRARYPSFDTMRKQLDKVLAAEHRTDWSATGIRITDSPQRALALTKYPNPHPKNHTLAPVATWRKQQVWDHIKAEGLPISAAYPLFGRSMDCLNITHVYPLKAARPADYAKIVADFPLMEPLCWLYEQRAQRHGPANLPEC